MGLEMGLEITVVHGSIKDIPELNDFIANIKQKDRDEGFENTMTIKDVEASFGINESNLRQHNKTTFKAMT